MPSRIGIDLGTTYCVMAMIDPKDNSPAVIKNSDGEILVIPSVIYFQNGLYAAGLEAKEKFLDGDNNCAVCFKRSMGEKEEGSDLYCFTAEEGTPYERKYTAVELSAMLLDHLREEAEAAIGDTVSEAVITCPAYYYSNERKSVMEAANSIGLKVIELLEEPSAAALAYGLRHWRVGARVLVYDLGGGTFDTSLVEMCDDYSVRVIRTMGRKYLGGEDFDKVLYQLVMEKMLAAADISAGQVTEEERNNIQAVIESIKIKLSSLQTARVTGIVGGVKTTIEITRDAFEKNTEHLLEDTGDLIDQLFKLVGIQADDIADVLLTGGSTLMPCVREYLTRKFGKPPLTHVNPTTAVALGAAMRTVSGASTSIERTTGRNQKPSNGKDGSIGFMDLRKSATHTMGIIAITENGAEYYNEHIIPTGTGIPCSFARKFRYFTSKKSENKIEIYLLQGESQKPSECHPQKKFVVSGIRHIKNRDDVGTLIRIQYSYDNNGIIHVQARQEDDTVDLPIIETEVPPDMSKYNRPVEKEKTGSSFLGIGFGGGLHQDVVHKYKEVTFSNVKWVKYDNVGVHRRDPAEFPNEPQVHVIANKKNIEFHGYNISQMDEGVYYNLDANDNFEIECSIDTTGIDDHPGGHVNIVLGIVTAKISEKGGTFLIDGKNVASVGTQFKLKMSFTDGKDYELYIDDKLVGSATKKSSKEIRVVFGMEHESHHCDRLSRAYITNIEMKQRSAGSGDNTAETWEIA